MNRKAEVFFDAITLLPEELVEEAQTHVFRKDRTAWKKVGSLAACMMLVVSLGLLAALPRGCGGAAPGPESNDAAPPAVSGDKAPEGGYGSSSGAAPQDAPQTPEAIPGDGLEAVQFTARVVEVLDAGTRPAVLVEPLEGEPERNTADRIVVSVDGELPVLAEGDLVRITYDGMIQETYPAGIAGAASVEKLEEGE